MRKEEQFNLSMNALRRLNVDELINKYISFRALRDGGSMPAARSKRAAKQVDRVHTVFGERGLSFTKELDRWQKAP